MTLKTQIIDGKKKWTFEMSTGDVEALLCMQFNHFMPNSLPLECYEMRNRVSESEATVAKFADVILKISGQRCDFLQLVLLEEVRNGRAALTKEDLVEQGVPIP